MSEMPEGMTEEQEERDRIPKNLSETQQKTWRDTIEAEALPPMMFVGCAEVRRWLGIISVLRAEVERLEAEISRLRNNGPSAMGAVATVGIKCDNCGAITPYSHFDFHGNATDPNTGTIHWALAKWGRAGETAITALERADAEAEQLKAVLERREQGTYCAYCGFEVACDDEAGSKISEHIEKCPKHPVSKLKARLAKCVGALERAKRQVDAVGAIPLPRTEPEEIIAIALAATSLEICATLEEA